MPSTENILKTIKNLTNGEQKKVVFVSGNFNIIHPGHLRLLNFAKSCGDILIVGVISDAKGNTHISENYRLEGIQSVSIVDFTFILDVSVEEFISKLKPNIVVKGKEHEFSINNELAVLESYGGKLLFSSGDVRFSSLDLLQKEYFETDYKAILKPTDFPQRHDFNFHDLVKIINEFSKKKVIVIGDLIIDEYIECDPLGMSREDPTIVVTPIRKERFIGGAGIVAAHASGLGAEVKFYSVSGDDDISDYAHKKMKEYGVDCKIIKDESRPTTLKQRFKAEGKTLLRVSHLRQHDISQKICDEIVKNITADIADFDLLIFSDFNYGALPQNLVDKITAEAEAHNLFKMADSQSSSQIGDVSRFHNMELITPTEHEARISLRDTTSGLVVLADKLQHQCNVKNLILTLGKEGILIHAPLQNNKQYETDRLPAFNTSARDASGAGDSFMISTALSLATGANIWSSAYIGSIAAACQVSREGNSPLMAEELITELML